VKVLFDQNVPRPLTRFLILHQVSRLVELGWQELANGDLIAEAEIHGFEVFVTADKNLRYQQNLKDRKLAIIVLPSGRWPALLPFIENIVLAIDEATLGTFKEINGFT
jgi:hypothetical protein